MNILIKLTCLVGLVIAPILGSGHGAAADKAACCSQSEMHAGHHMKCDMAKMATMTKDECAKMCDEMGCSEEQKAMCLSHFDANGKFMKKADCKMACCAADGMMRKEVSRQVAIHKEEVNGKVKATVKITSEVNGKATTEEKVFEGTETEVQAKIDEFRDK